MDSHPPDGLPATERPTTTVRRQLSELRPLLLLLYVPTLLGIGVLVVVDLVADIPLRLFFIDPVAEFAAPMYVGLVSNFGVALWVSTASVCLFGAWLLHRDLRTLPEAQFLLGAGLISAVLGFDDLYLMHEEVLPERLHIPEPVVFAAYGALVLGFLFRFRKPILRSEFALLLLAFGFFAFSIFVDVVIPEEEFEIVGDLAGRHLIEDGFKLFGIVSWTAYFWRVAVRMVGGALRRPREA